jgi:hypothetical protein
MGLKVMDRSLVAIFSRVFFTNLKYFKCAEMLYSGQFRREQYEIFHISQELIFLDMSTGIAIIRLLQSESVILIFCTIVR